MTEKRIFGLDLVRAIAILGVLFSHGDTFLSPYHLNIYDYLPLPNGVELFFVLSGFLIGQILLRILYHQPLFTIQTIIIFWQRRWFRTLPAYYTVLIINCIITFNQWSTANPAAINWKFILFLQNFDTPFTGFFWESWSLSVEEWFYVFFPLVLWGIYKVAYRFLSKGFIFAVALLLLLSLPLILRYLSWQQLPATNYFDWDIYYRKIVVLRLDAIGYGVLGAVIKYFLPTYWYSNYFRWGLFVLGCMAVLYDYTAGLNVLTTYGHTCYFSVQALKTLCLFPLIDAWQRAPLWCEQIIGYISKISYSLYLVNLCIVIQVIDKFYQPPTMMAAISVYVLFWVLSFVLAGLLYYLIEKPFIKLRPGE
jgi:peptidoglycan/LPS O-acetylase OafA/YrhL